MNKRHNLNLERFIKIDKGNYRIGINKDIIESISRNSSDSEIKKEFLLNSYPEHNVEIEEAFISRYLVTLAEFKEFIYKTGYETEAEIEKALEAMMSKTTSFIVAQRISTVLKADKILVLDNGRIAAEGSHAELMETSPIYMEIYDSQLGGGGAQI